ncbi:NADH:flavin oxidoreductase [uncultured Chitinophaga sp.]|jgi:NADH:flavin oxidoreductases, Old Yellow Enzyme family|uniref:NADH:flavin oxidoreductase n=1 Tax=uncultured Chitinophaga sp. TaxID=339340 RepID=UPI002622B352|nr:NADH:flavin oxidoreductase [uncultured Chitinophaga sp.]
MYTNNEFTPAVFNALHLGTHLLRNRFAVAPMSRVSAGFDGVPTANMQAYYEAFASGGFSLIITEGIYTDDIAAQAYPRQPGLVTMDQQAGWKHVTLRVKQHGAVFIAQLMHAGAISQHLPTTWAPSAVLPLGKKMQEYGGGDGPFPIPHAMTITEITLVKQGFVQSALRALAAGFDGVELHAANGYLLDQFMTDDINLRTDLYGGSIPNRFRIIKEIIEAIRAVVPPDFIIGLRLSEGKVNNLHYRWADGPVTAKTILSEVATVKPDYIHIAAEAGNWAAEATYPDGSSYTGLAKQLTGVPVIANGGLHQPKLARQVLEEGHADLIAIGKAAMANPDFPLRVQRGESIIPFHPHMIKPHANIEHTWKVLAQSTSPL